MCRQNQLFGCTLLAFGLGLLIGSWLDRSFLVSCIALGIVGCGVCVGCRK